MSLTNSPIAIALYRVFVESPRWLFNVCLFLIATVAYAWICHKVFNGIPRIDDSVAAVYQAKIFAAGNLLWPVNPETKIWFDVFGVISPIDKPEYFVGMYPPGWSLLLVPGVMLGVPWLINPILGGLLVVTISELTREMFGEVPARVAGLFALTSPYISVVSASHLSHTPAALGITLGWWATLRMMRTGQTRFAVVAGLAVGFTVLIRPETALLIGAIAAVGVLVRFRRALELWKPILVAIALAGSGALTLLAWQDVAVGKAGMTGHRIDMKKTADFGFGRVGDSSYIYTPEKAHKHNKDRFRELDKRLLGWPIPAWILVLAPFFLFRGFFREFWLLGPVLSLAVLYFYYWYWEEWLVARYYFTGVPFLLVLAAKGWHDWQHRLRPFPVLNWVPVLMLVVGVSWSVAVHSPKYHRWFQPHHGDVEDLLPVVMKHHKVGEERDALVFIARKNTLRGSVYNDYYATGFHLNDLDLKGPVLFARDGRDKKVRRNSEELVRAYPGRDYFLYEFDQRNKISHLFRLNVDEGYILGKTRLKGEYSLD